MTTTNAIDLSQLPPPEVVETVNFEQLRDTIKADLENFLAELGFEADLLDSDPAVKIVELIALRELLLRNRINDAARNVMLATASGANLDNLAALYGLVRRPGDSDEKLRRDVQLSVEASNTTGSEASYILRTQAATYDNGSFIETVKDVAVVSPVPGVVEVTVMSDQADGTPSDGLINAVKAILNRDDVRPITDRVVVAKAIVKQAEVKAQLEVASDLGLEEVRQQALAALAEHVRTQHRLGQRMTRSGIIGALMRPGVQNVILMQPAQDILVHPNQTVYVNPEQFCLDNENPCIEVVPERNNEQALPINGPQSANFVDTSPEPDQISGTLTVVRAEEEFDIQSYVVYWGISTEDKLLENGQPVEVTAPIVVDRSDCKALTVAINASLGGSFSSATHWLIYSANASGENANPFALALTDIVKSRPQSGPAGIQLAEPDPTPGQLGGRLRVMLAPEDRDNIQYYSIYWADQDQDGVKKLENYPAIVSIASSDGDAQGYVEQTLLSNLIIPEGATHLLAYAQNELGESETFAEASLSELRLSLPTYTAEAIHWSDIDYRQGRIAGRLNIEPATDESDIDGYRLYWGKSATQKLDEGAFINAFVKQPGGASLEHIFAANTSVPEQATHFLVYSYNKAGEMANGISILLNDQQLPTVTPGPITLNYSGQNLASVTIQRADPEDTIASYVIYLGNQNNKLMWLAEVSKAESADVNTISYLFSPELEITASMNYIWVFTKNTAGEMATGISVLIDPPVTR